MATINANEPKLTVGFAGTGFVNDLTRIRPLRDSNILFPPVPPHTLYTSHPLNRGNEEMGVATFPFIWSQLPESTVKCCAKPLSGGPQFFLKVVLHLEAGQGSLQSGAWSDLLNEARFYSEHLSEFQGDIVPRHYGVFAGNTSWGGTIGCAVLDYFPGLPWTWIQNGPGDILESERIVADAVVKLHDAGIDHDQLYGGCEHHILYDHDTKRVNLVGFATSDGEHQCDPDSTEPLQKVASAKELCSVMDTVANTLTRWYHDRERKFDEEKETSKQTEVA